MRVDLTESITAQQTRAEQMRKGAKLTDKGTIRKLLEEISDPDRPLVIEIYGTRKDKQPNDYFLRECRGIFIFESAAYKEFEKNRLEEEEEGRKQAARQVKLDGIKTRLRARSKVDDADFDKKYAAQSGERLKVAESEIEKEAAAILEDEEKQLNK